MERYSATLFLTIEVRSISEGRAVALVHALRETIYNYIDPLLEKAKLELKGVNPSMYIPTLVRENNLVTPKGRLYQIRLSASLQGDAPSQMKMQSRIEVILPDIEMHLMPVITNAEMRLAGIVLCSPRQI
ncbi:MAG: hypothetical protein H7308_10945 [Chthonomonadaceae bacterium]|nr:hypothetical protein [Chthonomonadaceae bacterium]